jgi:hypothetical protein
MNSHLIYTSKKVKIMSKKAPNKFFAPIVIAGITIGFLASAYQFIFAQKKRKEKQTPVAEQVENEQEVQK